MNYMLHHGHGAQTAEDLASLVADLHHKDGLVRRRARQALVEMGERAVPELVRSLESPNEYTRWEAAKALSEIHAPEAAPALVKRLEDENFSVRWLAAEALIGLHLEGLEPLLQALVHRPDSVWLRQGAHHVLRALAKNGAGVLVGPVLEALDGLEPILQVPIAAEAVLQQIAGVS